MPLSTKQKHLGLLLIGLIPFAYFSYLNRFFQLDDALIYQRYIHNLLDGHGLVYNKGELFNGLTSPLYTYLSIAASYLLGNVQWAMVALSAVLMLLALVTLTIVFSRYENVYFVLCGAMLMVFSPYFYYTYGMETPLFILLIGICIYLFEKGNYALLGIACALLLLTRGEGIFLILAMAVEHFRQRRPFPKPRYFVVPILIVAANLLFNRLYYGSFLPHTILAKVYQGNSGFWGSWPAFAHVRYHLEWFFDFHQMLPFSLFVLAFCGVLSLRLQSLNVISICFLTFYTIFYVFLNLPNYHWYYAPYYAFAFFYAGPGVGWLVRQFRSAEDRLFRITATVALGALLFYWVYQGFFITKKTISQRPMHLGYYQIGLWLRENTPSDAKIAAVEIGTVGFYSQRYIVDILGVVSPLNAEFLGDRRLGEWLNHYAPDYVLVHDPMWPLEAGMQDAIARERFVEDTRFNFPGYKLYVSTRKGASLGEGDWTGWQISAIMGRLGGWRPARPRPTGHRWGA